MGLFSKKSKPITEPDSLEEYKGWYLNALLEQQNKYKMSTGYSSYNSYEDQVLNHKVDSLVRNILSEQTKEAEIKANIKLVTGMIKAFKLDYGTGEEVLNLFKSGDENNEKMATTMLFASMRNGLKEEIINEINKK